MSDSEAEESKVTTKATGMRSKMVALGEDKVSRCVVIGLFLEWTN